MKHIALNWKFSLNYDFNQNTSKIILIIFQNALSVQELMKFTY